mmetsp:Transcript_3577/g.13077  ORF Transcript_3577/g.13077 Transcript_3577/m.13077 type:complete len:287 (+) Transcript_3577:1555-2415(+)
MRAGAVCGQEKSVILDVLRDGRTPGAGVLLADVRRQLHFEALAQQPHHVARAQLGPQRLPLQRRRDGPQDRAAGGGAEHCSEIQDVGALLLLHALEVDAAPKRNEQQQDEGRQVAAQKGHQNSGAAAGKSSPRDRRKEGQDDRGGTGDQRANRHHPVVEQEAVEIFMVPNVDLRHVRALGAVRAQLLLQHIDVQGDNAGEEHSANVQQAGAPSQVLCRPVPCAPTSHQVAEFIREQFHSIDEASEQPAEVATQDALQACAAAPCLDDRGPHGPQVLHTLRWQNHFT